MFDRRTLLGASGAWALGTLTSGFATNSLAAQAGQKRDRSNTSYLITPEAKAKIQTGLSYLDRVQRSNGAIGSGPYAENVSVTSLAALAFMSSGSSPDEGPYAKNIDKALEFVLSHVSPSGFCVNMKYTSHGPMYDHGFGTLFLAEAYGMSQREELRERLKKAVNLIIRTQNDEGGWRYQPQRTSDADISVTISMIMALRAARNAGINVPKSCADKCIDYVRKCQNGDGGFRYQKSSPTASGFARSAAGLVALFSAGVYEGRDIERGLEYVKQFSPQEQPNRREPHYYYGHYYAVQAMYLAGDKYWLNWYPHVRDELISRARTDGYWSDSQGNEYATAMALIILQIPNNFLPIFQR